MSPLQFRCCTRKASQSGKGGKPSQSHPPRRRNPLFPTLMDWRNAGRVLAPAGQSRGSVATFLWSWMRRRHLAGLCAWTGTSLPRGHARSGYCPARRGRLTSRPRNTCTALLLPGLPPWFRPRTSSTARKHDGKVDPVELIRDDHLIEHRSGSAGRGHHRSVLDESRLRVSQ